MSNNNFITLLKKYTNIDTNFIDTFFSRFEIGSDLDFHIEDIDVANYFNINLKKLRTRLRNQNNKNDKEIFYENVDFIRVRSGKTSGITYFLNYACFEKIAMSSKSKKAGIVRMYFVKLREFIVEHQDLIYQSFSNKDALKKYAGIETIYFFAVDETKDFFKIGRTSNILQRLRNYNIGRIKEIELKYLVLVKNSRVIEKCIGLKLDKNRVEQNKEIFKVKPEKIKKIIDECYCQHVNQNEQEELYEDLANLLNLYSYVKNKVNIKPFVIIR